MPVRYRKKIGGKGAKLNVTENGVRSATFTNGATAEDGGLRVNYNTKRGLSASAPGTGLSWVNRNYNKSNGNHGVIRNTVNAISSLATTVFLFAVGLSLILSVGPNATPENIEFGILLFKIGMGFYAAAWCYHNPGKAFLIFAFAAWLIYEGAMTL